MAHTVPDSYCTETAFARPIFEVDSEDNQLEAVGERVDDASSHPNRVEIEITDHGQQNIVLRAKEYSNDECVTREHFKVTDPQRQICSYQGETVDDLSLDVIWAVYLEGFAIKNLDTYSQEFIDLMEALLFDAKLQSYQQKYADVPLVRQTIRDLNTLVGGIAQLLKTRYIMDEETYRHVFKQFEREQVGISAGEIPDENPTKYAMQVYDFTHELSETRNIDEQFDEVYTDVDGGVTESKTFSHGEYEAQGTTYHHIGVFTERGAVRYEFQQTGDDRAVFQRRHGRPHPDAVLWAERAEPNLDITNATTTITASSLDELVEAGTSAIDEIRGLYQDGDMCSMNLLCAAAMRKLESIRFTHDVVEEIGESRFIDCYKEFTTQNNLPDDIDMELGYYTILGRMDPLFSPDEHETIQSLQMDCALYDETPAPP